MEVRGVEVEAEGDIEVAGEPAKNVTCRAKVTAHSAETEIRDLMSR